jgi:hypothetical protein
MNEPSPNMTKSRKTRDSPMHKNIFECSHCRETFEEIKMCSGCVYLLTLELSTWLTRIDSVQSGWLLLEISMVYVSNHDAISG